MIQAVLFDMGGTLHVSDSPPGRAEWFARRLLDRLADYDIHIDADPAALVRKLHENSEAYKHWGEANLRELPQAQVWHEWYLRDWDVDMAKLAPIAEELSFLHDYERTRTIRRPHLRQCMDQLRDMGMRLGVISNVMSASVMPHYLKEYGLDTYMDCVLLSCTAGARKPDPAIFRQAEQAMGLGPEAFAYVGDTLSRDVRGVRNAGWRLAIQIKNPSVAHRDTGLEGLYSPDYLIEDLAEIPAIIQKENEK